MAQAGPRSGILSMGGVDLAAAIAARKVSCVEVMGAYLDHIEALNPAVGAIVAVQDRVGLMAQARTRDEEVGRGDSRGVLHGFPLAPKDLQWVKGIVSTSGSPILKDFTPDSDMLPVERMRAAGAVFIGKTNTPEFGLGSHTYNPVYGPTLNAYDQTKSAGGSSGGAAVALALRMAPVADGSDYGGSLRNPAGWNNVYGFRPGPGVVSTGGDEVWIPTMGVSGPMARSVPDLALLLSVMAGHDARAPLSAPGEGRRFLAPLGADMTGKRIGWLGDFGGEAPCEAGLLDVCGEALKTFGSVGCPVEPALPGHPVEPVWQAFQRLRHWQAGFKLRRYHDDPAMRALLKPEAAWEVENGLALSAYDITAASVVRAAWGEAVRRLFETYDYLLAPTAQVFPFDVGETWPRQIGSRAMRTYHEWMKGVCLVSMTGCPSLAVPAGFNTAGLPMGLQIIAPIGREMDCLRLAHAYEQASPWIAARIPALLEPILSDATVKTG